MTEKRRDVRYPARIVARVFRRSETVELLTNDVSFRGAFIRTDMPPALRQLVRVAFTLPSGATVSAHAMVVRIVTPAEGGAAARVPGVGVQFWGALEGARAWETFIQDLKQRDRAALPAPRTADKIRRSSERFRMVLDVDVAGQHAVTRDVSETGMAVRTESPLPVGARTTLQVRRDQEAVVVDVVVRRRIDSPDFKGLGLEFVDVTQEARRSIVEIVRAAAPKDDAVFISPDDPNLH